MIPVRSQWGRYNLPRYIYIYSYIYIYTIYNYINIYIYILYRWDATYYVSGMHIQIGYDRILDRMVSFPPLSKTYWPLHGTSSFTEPTTGMKLAKVISNILGTRSVGHSNKHPESPLNVSCPWDQNSVTVYSNLFLITNRYLQAYGEPFLTFGCPWSFFLQTSSPIAKQIIHG